MAIRVPYLEEKFEMLLQSGRRPDITTTIALRLRLELSATRLNQMLRDPIRQDQVSIPVFERICRTFALSRRTLLMEGLEDFRAYICDPKSVMQELVNGAMVDESRLKVVSREKRGITRVDNPVFEGGICYHINEQFSVQMEGVSGWSVLLMLKDAKEWSTLEDQDSVLEFPETASGIARLETRYYRFDPPIGQGMFLAVFTAKPIDQHIIKRIQNSSTDTERFEGCVDLSRYLSLLDKKKKQLYYWDFRIVYK